MWKWHFFLAQLLLILLQSGLKKETKAPPWDKMKMDKKIKIKGIWKLKSVWNTRAYLDPRIKITAILLLP